MSSLLSIFNVANTGLMSQQTALDVTSHNIANASTDGYSKQKAKLETTTPLGGNSINSGATVGQTGTGVQVTEIQRLTDKFISYQVRQQTSTQGTNEASEKYLSQVESVFNEPSTTGVSGLMTTFFSSWQTLSQDPSNSSARTTVAENSSALASGLNSSYNQLQKIKTNVNTETTADVYDTNNILNSIDDLNKQITTIKASGSEPNDLLDKRDVLLNKLSTKLGINVTESKNDGINITADEGNGVTAKTLISSDGVPEYRLSAVSSVKPDPTSTASGPYTVSYYKNGDTSTTPLTFDVTDKDEATQMSENGVLWTDSTGVVDQSLLQSTSGEMSGLKTVQQDVDTYTNQLNQVAKVLALSVNTIESGSADSTDTTSNTNPFFVNSDVATYTNNKLDNTSSVLSAETEITAGNISVNKETLNDVTKINTKTNASSGTTDGSRATAVANLQDSLLALVGVDSSTTRATLFGTSGANVLDSTGLKVADSSNNGMTMSDYFSNMIDKVGVQVQTATTNSTNGATLLNTYTKSLDSVSSVSLDEEMTNMIQYQHAYQANAKVITTLTTLLDVVIGLIR